MMRLLLAAVLCSLPALAEEVTTIQVVPGAHLDIGFTDTPDNVRLKRVKVLDDAIDAAQADPEFRWFEESGWTMQAWREAHAGDAKRLETLRGLLKEGRISFGAAWCNPHAAMYADHLDLLFFHLAEFEREFGVRPVTAVLNDVPMYPQALVDACAVAGVKYLLIGANTAFTPPLPPELERTPFWWESPGGNRVLVWVDDDSYTAGFTKWAVDPDGARFFVPKEFDPKAGVLETMAKGISARVESLATPRGAAIVQHAFDNWDCGSAKKLPGFAKQWNESKKGPRIVLGGPDGFFRDLEARCGKDLPVRRGEWGGAWDAGRACAPVWNWRLRKAMSRLRRDAPFETRALLATAMEHSQGLGPGWPGMLSEEQVLAHNAQVAGLFRRAVAAVDPKLVEAIPAELESVKCEGDPVKWTETLASAVGRIRAGQSWLGPFVVGSAPEIPTEPTYCSNLGIFSMHLAFDRSKLGPADATAVVEIPLRGAAGKLTLAPHDSPDALAGRWLRGEPPAFVVGPNGVEIKGLAHPILVTCDYVQSWCLVADKQDATKCWLQGLVVRQSRQCEFKDKTAKVLGFDSLYVGEPQTLKLDVVIELLDK